MDVACIDTQGNFLTSIYKERVPFDENKIAEANGLIRMLAPYVEEAFGLEGTLEGIGLSVCGNINPHTGEAVLVPNLHWRNLPFGLMVAGAFRLPVFAATDVRMATIAEVIWGKARGVENFAWATIGTGYGGYLFLKGRLFDGSHNFAGNFGHITLDEIHGHLCGCGRKGCVETFVAGPGIARAGQVALENKQSPALSRLAADGQVTSRMVFQAEAEGDPAACGIIEQVIRLIAINLGGVVNLLDLDMIVIGGSVSHGSKDFIDRISKRIRDYIMTVEARRDLRVVCESFTNSALVGAAADVFVRKGILSFNGQGG
jgi:glucokinase